jgi:hypothetical protein
MIEKIKKKIVSSYYFTLVLLIIALILSLINKEKECTYIVLSLLIADVIGLVTTKYRMRKGYFGDNEFECRELIYEALKHKNLK